MKNRKIFFRRKSLLSPLFSILTAALCFSFLTQVNPVFGLSNFETLNLADLNLANLGPISVQAQQKRGMIVTPAITDKEVDRGQSYQLPIQIENDSSQGYNLSVSLETFMGNGQEGGATPVPFKDSDLHQSWAKPDTEKIDLGIGQKKTINLNLTIPENASPGGYYYAVIFTNNKADKGENNIQIQERLSALVFIQVKGKIQRDIQIQKMQTDKSTYDPFFDPILLDYQVKVEGNSYLKPSGDLIVYSSDKIEKTTSLNPNQRIVLPGSTRQFSMYQKPVLQSPFGIPVEASGESIEFMPVSLFGTKAVETKIAFSNGENGIETVSKKTEVTFWPWKTVIALTSLILIILGAWQILGIIKKQKNSIKGSAV